VSDTLLLAVRETVSVLFAVSLAAFGGYVCGLWYARRRSTRDD